MNGDIVISTPPDLDQLGGDTPVVVIGAGFVDVVAEVANLPTRGGDLAARASRIAVGGCGLNVARALVRLGISVIPGIPIGRGPWADTVREELSELGLTSPLQVDFGDNGWCLAMVEPDGERTFVTIRGIERQLSSELLQRLTAPTDCLLYVSGYEFLEDRRVAVLEWLNHLNPTRWLLDPGPRSKPLPAAILARMSAGRAMLTVNEDEARRLCGSAEPDGIAVFAGRWDMVVIYRCGERGAWLCVPTQAPLHIPARVVSVKDTIGAGDAHAAGLLAALASGWSLPEAVWLGNQVAGLSVARPGAGGAPTLSELRAALT